MAVTATENFAISLPRLKECTGLLTNPSRSCASMANRSHKRPREREDPFLLASSLHPRAQSMAALARSVMFR